MNRLKKIVQLIAGLVGFYVLSTVVLKSFNESDFAEPIQSVVREQKIDPSAFFYSDNLFIDTTDIDVTIRN